MDLSHVSFVGIAPANPRALCRSVALLPEPTRRDRNPAQLEPVGGPGTVDPFAAWILHRAGVDSRAFRPNVLQRRIGACLRSLRVTSRDAAREQIERRSELGDIALNALLIGVSGFFRDPRVFQNLESVVLPELLRKNRPLRVCSIGASSGQELYSVAMLLEELGALPRCTLTGIDCRPEAITAAAEARYSESELAGIGQGRRKRHFFHEGTDWRIAPEIRSRVRWQVGDLFSFRAEEPIDLLLFRNVAIYFVPECASVAWTTLAAQLSPGGYLVSGSAEKPPASLPFSRVCASIYRKPAA